MTDPRYVRFAHKVREELETDAVVLITWSKGSMPHVVGVGTTDHQDELAGDMAAELVSSWVPTFLLRRGWGKGPTVKSRKLAGKEGAE